MKEKIELSQSDLILLLKEKMDFLKEEYKSLYGAFKLDKKSRATVDTVKITESYEKFLKEIGDVERINKLYDLFNDNKITITKTKLIKKPTES